MDAPSFMWDELVKFAENRDAWRAMVKTVRSGSRVQVDIRSRQYGQFSSCRATQPTAQQQQRKTRSKSRLQPAPRTMAAKYRDRDRHEAFFRKPADKMTRAKPKTKPKKKKPIPLTDKERRQFAREHYARHHGMQTTPAMTPTSPTTTTPKTKTTTTPSATPSTPTPPPTKSTPCVTSGCADRDSDGVLWAPGVDDSETLLDRQSRDVKQYFHNMVSPNPRTQTLQRGQTTMPHPDTHRHPRYTQSHSLSNFLHIVVPKNTWTPQTPIQIQ